MAFPINVLRRTRHISTEIVTPWPWVQENISGHIRYRRITPIDCTLSLDWDDEYNEAQQTVSLKDKLATDAAAFWGGNIYWGDSVYWSQGFSFSHRVSSMNLDPGGKGPGFYLTVSLATLVPFQVDSVEFD